MAKDLLYLNDIPIDIFLDYFDAKSASEIYEYNEKTDDAGNTYYEDKYGNKKINPYRENTFYTHQKAVRRTFQSLSEDFNWYSQISENNLNKIHLLKKDDVFNFVVPVEKVETTVKEEYNIEDMRNNEDSLLKEVNETEGIYAYNNTNYTLSNILEYQAKIPEKKTRDIITLKKFNEFPIVSARNNGNIKATSITSNYKVNLNGKLDSIIKQEGEKGIIVNFYDEYFLNPKGEKIFISGKNSIPINGLSIGTNKIKNTSAYVMEDAGEYFILIQYNLLTNDIKTLDGTGISVQIGSYFYNARIEKNNRNKKAFSSSDFTVRGSNFFNPKLYTAYDFELSENTTTDYSGCFLLKLNLGKKYNVLNGSLLCNVFLSGEKLKNTQSFSKMLMTTLDHNKSLLIATFTLDDVQGFIPGALTSVIIKPFSTSIYSFDISETSEKINIYKEDDKTFLVQKTIIQYNQTNKDRGDVSNLIFLSNYYIPENEFVGYIKPEFKDDYVNIVSLFNNRFYTPYNEGFRGGIVKDSLLISKQRQNIKSSLKSFLTSKDTLYNIEGEKLNPIAFYNYSKGMNNFIKVCSYNFESLEIPTFNLSEKMPELRVLIYKDSSEDEIERTPSDMEMKEYIDNRPFLERLHDYKRFPLSNMYCENPVYVYDDKIVVNNINLNKNPLESFTSSNNERLGFNELKKSILKNLINKIKRNDNSRNFLLVDQTLDSNSEYYKTYYEPKISKLIEEENSLDLEDVETTKKKLFSSVVNDNTNELLKSLMSKEKWRVYYDFN